MCKGDIGTHSVQHQEARHPQGCWSCAERCCCAVSACAGRAAPARAAAPQKPITLSRNGKDFEITANQSTVRAGTEIRVMKDRKLLSV